MAYFIFSTVLSLFVIVSSTAASTNMSLLREVCPYSTFCTGKPLMELKTPDVSPCCVQCSCADNCALAGNCCPDKSTPRDVEPVYPCRTQGEILNKYLNRDLDTHYQLNAQFHVIDSCPSDAYQSSHLQTAVSRCHGWRSLEAVTFVSDPRGEYVFLNKYCAECNGVDNVITWTLKINCEDIDLLKLNSFKQRDDYILNSCGILSFPPEGHVVTKSRCYINNVKECNLTRNWDFYDEEINQMCRKYNVPYDYLNKHYANVFCFICNHPRETVYPITCENSLYWHMVENYFTIDFAYPFTALVSAQQEEDSTFGSSLPGAEDCGRTEIMDPYTRKCTDVICPLGTIPHHGTCRHLVEGTDGICITFRLGVQKTKISETALVEDRSELLVPFNESLSELLKAHGINCEIFYISLRDLNVDELLAETTLRTTKHCDHVKLLKAINGIFVENALDVKIRLIKEAINTEALEFIARKEIGFCVVGIELTSQTVYCPSIEYQRSDIIKKNMNSEITDEIFKQSVHIEEQKYRICIDKYLSTFAKTNLTAVGASIRSRKVSTQCILVLVSYLLTIFCHR